MYFSTLYYIKHLYYNSYGYVHKIVFKFRCLILTRAPNENIKRLFRLSVQ